MIRARINKKADSTCFECGSDRSNCLDLFDLKVGNKVITLCDKCTDDLFSKTLSCICHTQGRVKSPKDMKIIRARNAWKYKLQFQKRGDK